MSFTAAVSALEGATYTLFTTCADSDDDGTMLEAGSGNIEVGGTDVATSCTTANISVWAQGAASVLVATATAVTIAASVNLTATSYVAPTTVAVSYSDVPGGITGINARQALVTTAGMLGAPAAARMI